MNEAPLHGKSSTGLDEPLAGALSYVFGLITGIVFLAIERQSDFVRFHARQSIGVFTTVAILQLALSTLPGAVIWTTLFFIAVVVLWIRLMLQALAGKRYRVLDALSRKHHF